MEKIQRIHNDKQPTRPHHIVAWADKAGLKQSEIGEALNIDKSVVSRWFNGTTPGKAYQSALAALFHCEPESLFRHPDDDWLTNFFAGRQQEEIERIKATLEAAFPKSGTNG